MAYDADLDSTFNPSVGGTPTAAYLDLVNANFATLGGAWTAYTPSWTGSGGNPSIGNGTLAGAYVQLGKMVIFRAYLVMGSTTTYGSGVWSIGLPASVTGVAAAQPINSAGYDTSAGTFLDLKAWVDVSYSVVSIASAGGGYVTSTVPVTWATGDWLAVSGLIQVT